jgi:hypothetical protein
MLKAYLAQYVRLDVDQTLVADLPMYFEPGLMGVECTVDLMIRQAGAGDTIVLASGHYQRVLGADDHVELRLSAADGQCFERGPAEATGIITFADDYPQYHWQQTVMVD